MKSFIQTFAIVLCLSAVNANADGPLESIMKGMGAALKLIVKTVQTGAPLESAVPHAQEIQNLVPQAMREVPGKVEKTDDVQTKAALLLKYKRLLSQLYVLSLDLEESLTAKNLDSTKDLITKLNQVKKEGHDLFED